MTNSWLFSDGVRVVDRPRENPVGVMLTAHAYDIHAKQVFHRLQQVDGLLTGAGIPYRIVGGMAVFIHVFERDPQRARLTPDN